MDGFSLTTAMSVSCLLSFMISTYLLILSRTQRLGGHSRSYLWLALSYGLSGLRLGSQLLAGKSGPWLFAILGDLLYIGFVSTLWMGVNSYARTEKLNARLIAHPLLLSAWAVAARCLDIPLPWLALPQHVVGSAIFIASGYHIWSLHRAKSNTGHVILAIMMWLQGVSTATYPFTRNTWYAPYGFSLFSVLAAAIGMGFIISALRDEQMKLLEEMEIRKLAEDSRRKSFAFIEAILDNSPTGIVLFDADSGDCVLVNQAMADMVGGSVDALVEKNIWQIPSVQKAGLDAVAAETLRDGVTRQCECPIGTYSGKMVRAEFFCSRFYIERHPYLLLIALDITERTELQAQLVQSQKMEAIGQLAGGVAHDFNNILQVILGYGAIMKKKAKKAGEAEFSAGLEEIVSSAERAAQLTKGLLTFSRKQVLAPKHLDLNDVVRKMERFLVRIIGEDIAFRAVLHEGKLPVTADGSQVEQVLMNLATNARDAMPRGGALTVTTALKQEGGCRYAVVSVSDSGTGMDETTRCRIFEPFFTTKATGKGTGLGMAIVYGIVKQHNGFIKVQSEPGEGTTFMIHFPLSKSDATEEAEEAADGQVPRGRETILIAEDDAHVRKLMVTILRRYGYRVLEAVDGQEAVEIFRGNRGKVNLVVMDMIMPGKSGKEAYDEMCRIKRGMKVIFFSGYTADYIENRGLSGEGIDLIMKPVQPAELLRRVREVLDVKPASAEPLAAAS